MPDVERENINVFAETNFRNKRAVFGMKQDDRRRHMYLIGKTGMGKTNLMENMAIQDIKNGKGICIVDPHGQFAEKLLDYIPSSRINDVVYFNPTDVEHPIAFNVLERVDPQFRNLVADGLVGVFKKIWADSWGPRLEYLLRNTILSLLEYQDSTLLGVTRLLVDKEYRKKVVKKVQDPVVKAFWVEEFSKYHDRFLVEAISPIQNKVGQFLSNAVIRNIVGQTKSKIDVRKVMDEGKILILNLSKGKIGEESSALLGAMMITKIQLAAMSRADIPEEERKDFYLYVDEFQNFATDSFAEILSEARKYRLNLIIAHQYIGQLVTHTSTRVRDAVFGNVGTLVCFRVGAADAEFLEIEFEPIFMQNDLVNLTKFQIYLKLMIDGVSSDAFSAHVLPPMENQNMHSMQKVVKVSRERFASGRKNVEEKISRWSGVFDKGDIIVESAPRSFGGGDNRFKQDQRVSYQKGNTENQNKDFGFRQPHQKPRQQEWQQTGSQPGYKQPSTFSMPSKPVVSSNAPRPYSPPRPYNSHRTNSSPRPYNPPSQHAVPPQYNPPMPPLINRKIEEKDEKAHPGISLKEALKQEPTSFHNPRIRKKKPKTPRSLNPGEKARL